MQSGGAARVQVHIKQINGVAVDVGDDGSPVFGIVLFKIGLTILQQPVVELILPCGMFGVK